MLIRMGVRSTRALGQRLNSYVISATSKVITCSHGYLSRKYKWEIMTTLFSYEVLIKYVQHTVFWVKFQTSAWFAWKYQSAGFSMSRFRPLGNRVILQCSTQDNRVAMPSICIHCQLNTVWLPLVNAYGYDLVSVWEKYRYLFPLFVYQISWIIC